MINNAVHTSTGCCCRGSDGQYVSHVISFSQDFNRVVVLNSNQ